MARRDGERPAAVESGIRNANGPSMWDRALAESRQCQSRSICQSFQEFKHDRQEVSQRGAAAGSDWHRVRRVRAERRSSTVLPSALSPQPSVLWKRRLWLWVRRQLRLQYVQSGARYESGNIHRSGTGHRRTRSSAGSEHLISAAQGSKCGHVPQRNGISLETTNTGPQRTVPRMSLERLCFCRNAPALIQLMKPVLDAIWSPGGAFDRGREPAPGALS